MKQKIWSCKVGEVDDALVPNGGDAPMRDAVERAYRELTGREPNFIFSGWGAELTEPERAVVKDRLPSAEYAAQFGCRPDGTILRCGNPDCDCRVSGTLCGCDALKPREREFTLDEQNALRDSLCDDYVLGQCFDGCRCAVLWAMFKEAESVVKP